MLVHSCSLTFPVPGWVLPPPFPGSSTSDPGIRIGAFCYELNVRENQSTELSYSWRASGKKRAPFPTRAKGGPAKPGPGEADYLKGRTPAKPDAV